MGPGAGAGERTVCLRRCAVGAAQPCRLAGLRLAVNAAAVAAACRLAGRPCV